MIRYVPGTIPGLEGIQQIAIIDGDTHIGKWVEESGRLDHDQSALPRIGALIKPSDVVYDVGAFIGDHTAFYASKVAKDGIVVVFEANSDAWECLTANTRDLENVACFFGPVGDGATRGIMKTSTNAGASFFEGYNGGNRSERIDFLVAAGVRPPNLIKLDIEGWEVRALRGARETIAKHHPTIVCEVNAGALLRAGTSPAELHALLTSYGYTMRDLFTDEPWEPEDARPQFDIVAEYRS